MIASGIVMDERRLNEVNERLSTGYKLLKKHGVKTTDELLQVQQALSEKISSVLNIDEEIERAKAGNDQLGKEAEDLAAKISKGRRGAVEPCLN